ncbi:MAG: type II toxin-antitoxin system HicA family toxin [Armatimonadota bacterium]
MKRRAFIAHLQKNGCELLRQGAKHSVYCNSSSKRSSSVPRHSEINDFLAEKICRDLGIPEP